MWLYLGIFSAVFLGLYDITRKHALRGNAVLPVLFFATLAEALLLLPVALLSPTAPEFMTRLGLFIPQFGWTAHLLFFSKAILVAAIWMLGYFSIKHLPISIYSPISASGPAWTLVGAILIFGEQLTVMQWAAFGILIVSYYIFAIVGSREGIVFHTNKWVIFLFMAVLLTAASSLLDKYLIQTLGYSAVGVQVWFILYMVPIFGFAVLAFWLPSRAKHTPFEWRWIIPLIGVLLTIADIAYFKAIGCEGTLISLLAAVRSSSAVVSFLAGAIFFGEVRMLQKSWALAGVLVGVFLLFLSH
ncbi:MAG: DMT family transporter [Phycisphaerae bacterium]|nr:DMT family transporter [Phycisphaerae bacterium]MDD5380562.1 DMT family transporter [Phycisphaerae bacterium]